MGGSYVGERPIYQSIASIGHDTEWVPKACTAISAAITLPPMPPASDINPWASRALGLLALDRGRVTGSAGSSSRLRQSLRMVVGPFYPIAEVFDGMKTEFANKARDLMPLL